MNRFPPKRILVPLDFSKPSLAALDDAKILARRFGASLYLVYVQAVPLSLTGFEVDGAKPIPELAKQMEEFHQWREEKMRRALVGFPASRAKVRSFQGGAPSTIVDLASGAGQDLVVMGTHGYAGMDRVLFGSVAEAVVRRAKTPVLTTHPQSAKLRLSKIMLPFNMEDYATKALIYGLEWVHKFGSRFSVLHVVPMGFPEREARDVVTQRLKPILGKDAGKRILIRWGKPHEEILEAAARGRFDLIVLAAHRKPFLGDFIVGSTAERILRHSPVPVLSVPSIGSGCHEEGAHRPAARIG